MPTPHPTAPDASCQDSFRWSREAIFHALDDFACPDRPSPREFARQAGIPPATFNYWFRQFSKDPSDPVASFFCSAPGEEVLRHLLAAALLVFSLRGACGIRLVREFLQLTHLDRFVACSRGALHSLLVRLEADLVAFRDDVQPALAQQMTPQAITLVPDEHFHAGKPCLVALEPLSGFLAVECYRDHRDADTWTDAIQEGIAGMPVEVVQITSDRARGLLCCAEQGLQAAHSPDLFHGQRDLLGPLLLPLARPIQQAEKELQKVQQQGEKLGSPSSDLLPWEPFVALVESVKEEEAIRKRLEQARQRKEEALGQVRGVGDDYHPFDRETGKPVTAPEVGQRLGTHLDGLEAVVQAAELGPNATQAVVKARAWVGTLVGVVAWFWCLARQRVDELDLNEEQEQVVYEKLVAGHYWGLAAGRARTAPERERLKEMAARLKQEAWQEGSALASLSEEERTVVEDVARASAGLFQRSSSSVEGRNGRLSLQQHGPSRVSERRLKALTVIHNYQVKRSDETTAAERFFGQKPKGLFNWLLQRMPDLPRPAATRSPSTPSSLPKAG